jgi:hypothetical protein
VLGKIMEFLGVKNHDKEREEVMKADAKRTRDVVNRVDQVLAEAAKDRKEVDELEARARVRGRDYE